MTLGLLGGPGVLASEECESAQVEIDARVVPWSTLNRLALLAGNHPPHQRPLTGAELAGLIRNAAEHQGEANWWADKFNAARSPRPWQLAGRVLTGFTDRGSILPGEAGLSWAPGWNATFEPEVVINHGRYWGVLTGRLTGRLAAAGTTLAATDPLAYPGWTNASGLAQVRRARLRSGAWTGDLPRLLVGAQLGNWSLSAGWAPRRTGPGNRGALVLDHTGASFPAFTARRTAPFVWSGIMTHAAPDHLFMRAGLLSRRSSRYQEPSGFVFKQDEPWFMQWLLGWEVTDWFRASFTHTVMASARDGETLWPDLPQINFPIIGTTWREYDSGPVTDRLFAVLMEFRWGQAPWPFLPSSAGRLYWDYGGTDFLPSGPGGIIPQISIPASVAGCELVGRHWDLVLEYAETYHDKGQWYINSGFPEGYSHEGWLLAHAMGGGSEAFHAQVRVRPASLPVEIRLAGDRINRDYDQFFPTSARREGLTLEVVRRMGSSSAEGDRPLRWKAVLEYVSEKVGDPYPAEAGWWRSYVVLGY
jgi:hypothetical protein